MEKKVKNLIYVILLILSTGWYSSCNDDPYDKPVARESLNVTFALKMPSGNAGVPGTYAVSDMDENYISDIDILIFRPDGSSPSGWSYAYRAQASGTAIRDKGDYSTKEFTIRLNTAASQQNLVVLANVRDQVDVLSPAVGADKDQLLAQLTMTHTGRWNARLETGDTGPFTPFPMWGETIQIIGSTTTQITGVALMRGVARVDVALSDAVTNFDLTKVYVYNSKNQCRVVPDAAKLSADGRSVTAATVPPGDINNTPLEYTLTTGARAMEHSIFLCEAAGPPADQPGDATCIILGGTYAGAVNYYRIDIFRKDAGGNNTQDFRDFLRNHRYRVLVNKVTGPGFSTPDEAFGSKAVNITAEVLAWNEGDVGDVIIDGQYVFSIDPVRFAFTRDAVDTETMDSRLALFTDHPDGWKIESIADGAGNAVTWFDVKPAHSGAAGATGTSWVQLKKNNMLDGRIAYITVKAGRIRYKVAVAQDGFPALPLPPSNCYMVAPGGDALLIPVARANDAVPGSIPAGDAYTVETLWQDAAGVVDTVVTEGAGPNGYVRVIPGAAEGNALVAVKVNNTIVWSWHIWATGYNPDPATDANSWTYNGYTFMDRNLGATDNTFSDASRGLFYQWGRKDPMPATDDVAGFSTASGPVDQTTAHRNPDKFYYNSGDWISTPNDNLWGHEATKSVYDPCPEGWRVPSWQNNVSPWDGLNNGNFLWQPAGGRQYGSTTTSRHPASGFRSYSTGSLDNVSSIGHYWSASPSSTIAYYLYFTSASVTPPNNTYRGFGFSVRCARYTILTVDKTGMNLDYDAQNTDNAANRLTIYTDNATGWTVESIYEAGTTTTATWLDVMAGQTSSQSGTDGISYRWIKTTKNLGRQRSAIITLKAGNMRCRITVTQALEAQPVSNCYIVAPGSRTIYIPVDRAISHGDMVSTDRFTAAELWDDNNVVTSVGTEGSGSTGYITVNVHASNQGNALVALKVGNTICWSWHIWVTTYNPVTPTTANSWTYNNGYNTYTFMDRNLGATANDFSVASRGLHYQWGRKDPMPATNISGFSVSKGPVSQQVAHRNPDKFYSVEGDWLSTPNDNLWGHNNTKSIYDPCPTGWRVPSWKNSASPWYNLTNNNFRWNTAGGRWYNSIMTSRHPAAGFRDYPGSLSHVGSYGDYWSASPFNGHAYYMAFSTQSFLQTAYSNYRTYGLSVRCVRE